MQEKSYQMCRRLQIGIKLMLKECPVLPVGFKFNGECILSKYKREERLYIENTHKELGLNTVESVEHEFTSPDVSPIKGKPLKTDTEWEMS